MLRCTIQYCNLVCGIYLSRCVRMGDEDVSGCVRKNKSKIGAERVSGYVKMCQDVQVSTYYRENSKFRKFGLN